GRIPRGVHVRNAVTIAVDKSPGVDVRLPLVNRNLTKVQGTAGIGQSDGGRNTVHNLVIPLVKDGELPITLWNTGKVEIAIPVALDECKVRPVRISQTGIALGEGKAVARAAAIEPLIRRPAHARCADVTFHLV